MKYLLYSILLFLGIAKGYAQHSIGIRLFGLSIHPYGEVQNAHIMPLKYDRDAYFVQNLGALLSYEYDLYRNVLFAKGVIGVYSDCAAQLGGFFHLGLRGRIFSIGRHHLLGGVGPTLIYRQNWLQLSGYTDQQLFKGSKDDAFQYLFLWYAGDFDYRYTISDRVSVGVTFVPGYPDLMSLSVGLNYLLR